MGQGDIGILKTGHFSYHILKLFILVSLISLFFATDLHNSIFIGEGGGEVNSYLKKNRTRYAL